MLSRVDPSPRSASDPAAFGIVQRELDRHTTVTAVEGEIDLSTAPRLKWMLIDSLDAGHSRLIVDLSLATFMDSTALGVLIGVKRGLDPDGRLAIVCRQPDVLKIFELSGIDGAFAIFPTVDDALAYTRANSDRGN